MSEREQTGAQVLTKPNGYSSGATVSLPKKRNCTYAELRKMRKDPTIALARWMSCAPIIASGWTIEAKENAPEGAKEFVESQVQSFRFHLVRNAIYGMTDFGWQPNEVITQIMPDSGLIGVKKLKPLLVDNTDVIVDKDTGAYMGLKNFDTELNAEDTLTFTFEAEGTNWYGEPILENARHPQRKWDAVEDAATRYDDKIAGTHLVVYYPDGKTDGRDNFEIAQEIVDKWQASGAVAVPRSIKDYVDELAKNSNNGWEIVLLTDGAAGRGAFVDRQKYLDTLKVRAFGLPERAILEGQFGTKAESEAHGDFAIVNMELRHLDICQTVNWHLINRTLIRPNFGQQFENSVYVVPNPISDAGKTFLRDLFKNLMANPETGLLLTAGIDMDQLQQRLDVPTKRQEQVVPESELPQVTDIDPATPTPV